MLELSIFFTFAELKKATAIFFLFIFLSANTVIGQVLRLQVLVHHYLEHVEWDNNTSVLDFLVTHYAVEINHPDDQHHDHQKLPFKTTCGHISHVVTIIPQHVFSITSVITETDILKHTISNQQDYSDSYLNNIWQPPRLS